MFKNFCLLLLVIIIISSFQKSTTNMIITEKDLLLGMFNPEENDSFIEIPLDYASRKEMFIQKEVLDSFIIMYNKAREDGISLKIISATRNFNRQKQIWEKKWRSSNILDENERAKDILKYSAMPGTSRHHWGTDIDINSLSPRYFKSGKGLKEHNWLVKNANKFGFCQPYKHKSDSIRLYGYEDEPWHWSFMPIANDCMNGYKEQITYDDIVGFDGSETAITIDVINNFVFGINNECLCDE